MSKFEFIHGSHKESGIISTAVNSAKDELLNNPSNYLHVLKKQADKHHLDLEILNQKVIKMIEEENGGVLPDFLEKYRDLKGD